MTTLSKPVIRTTSAVRHEKSKTRALILSLELPAKVGVRLAGTRDTFRLDAVAVYELAVMAHERAIEREARRIVKAEKIPLRTAKSRARKALRGLLR